MKRAYLCLILCMFFLAPSFARAAGSGFYLTPKFIMSLQNTGPFDRSEAISGSGVDEYDQFSLGGALAAGIDFWDQEMLPLRVEVEFALRSNATKTWTESGLTTNSIKGTWNNSTLFANFFWDFRNESRFVPYVGAGLGVAFNYTGYDITTHTGDHFSIDDRQTNFAWNAGAGISYYVNDVIDLDAAYRFVGLGYNEVSGYAGGHKYELGNEPYNNEFTLGVRFKF